MNELMTLQMLEELGLRIEYSVVARDMSEDDFDNWVRSEEVFESADRAEMLADLMRQFKQPDDTPRYTEIALAQRFVTDWSQGGR